MEGKITLSELNSLVKDTLDEAFPEQMWVIAEIGELNVNRAGHCYIELVEKENATDEITARSRATIWSWQYRFIQPYFETSTGQELKAGLKVLVSVSVEFHEVYGYSLNIKDIDPAFTLGDMARKRQEIIKKLSEDGVFDMNKEIPLADIPSRIAIISSPTAAGYSDFMKQLHQNAAGYIFYTKLFSATMQGNDAANSIIAALEFIYEYENFFDAVVIIRGGGSQMDLSCFDDYELAFYVTQFPLPILTGIGHDKDESITDMVANTQLKTPTAVAEFLIANMDVIAEEIDELESTLFNEVDKLLKNEAQRLSQALRLFKPLINSRLERTEMQLLQLAKSVKPIINDVIDQQQFNLIQLKDHLELGSISLLKAHQNKLLNLSSSTSYLSRIKSGKVEQLLEDKLQHLLRITNRKFENEHNKIDWLEKNKQLVDPQIILKRGFSITLKNGKAVKNASELSNNEELTTILYKGKVKSTIKK